MKKYKIGYTSGVYDMFHIGHLNLIKRAKEQCEYLVVGVTTDKLAQYKNKTPIIPYEERKQIVEALKYVDEVVPQESMDKLAACKKLNADVIFVGDDWKGTDKWNKIEEDLATIGAEVVYFSYTKGTSSTILREKLLKK
jgi:glycerol-3-phosphate cytidylyltransferase